MINNNLVQRSDELDTRLSEDDNLNQTVADWITYGKRSRKLIRLVIFSIILELILLVSFIFIYTKQQSVQAQTMANHNALVTGCLSGNEFRKSNLTLWDYAFSIPPDVPPSPQQQQKIDDFKVFIKKTFALRDCNAIK